MTNHYETIIIGAGQTHKVLREALRAGGHESAKSRLS